jgi:YD repeat-containing protein
MITKYKKHHRIIATFFLLIFFPTLVPNNLFASNNGPKSPEAASFEPVDATDMVNLITGQYSYVLPLLNVPSPEGGYPLAIGYHAGIALDQESSWVGLGWNVNPGAIDRGVNGYPDDYNSSHLNEYFYDSGGTISTYSASVGYSCGVASVGLGFNWGNDQARGGFVSAGVGIDLGGGNNMGVNAKLSTNRDSSIGVGVRLSGGLSIGVNVGISTGKVEASAGFDNNGSGFNISTDGSVSIIGKGAGKSSNVGITLSSSGGHFSYNGAGLGMSTSFNNTIKMGDYSTSSSSWMIPLAIPTPIGIFSLSFGKQTFKYWLSKNENNSVSGPIYFNNSVQNLTTTYQVWVPLNSHELTDGHWETRTRTTATNGFMDINETPILNNDLSKESKVINNNIDFPSYDSYNIQAQGISGSMSPTLYENGALFGLSGKENKDDFKLDYSTQITNITPIPNNAKFDSRPNFYLDNEVSSYLNTNVSSAVFNSNTANSSILSHYSTGVDPASKSRRKTSTFVEYYTNDEIINNNTTLKQNGYLKENVSGFDRSKMPKNGIGAFKITTVDGKTYHYSLPAYNHEIITRTIGVIEEKKEEQSYLEKRQLEPYATHWLLTAVTGPDFVDNGDGIAGDGDLGYWTSFEYGKWTDAFIWKAPYKKEAIIDDTNPAIKTWIRGRKQLYYLDKVKTRTHTALFIKSERTDAPSENWAYFSVNHLEGAGPDGNPYVDRFTVPSQNQLRLDKIILLKNGDDTANKTFGVDNNQSVIIGYPNSEKSFETAKYNMYDNILDVNDNWQGCIAKAIKVIDFSYDASLVPGDNRLTLKSVNFKGKAAANVLPPYMFDYNNETSSFDINKGDGWGYLAEKPYDFSLRKITTPQGGTIEVNYESNIFKSVIPVKLEFSNMNLSRFTSTLPTYANQNDLANKTVVIDIGSSNNYPNLINKTVSISLIRDYVCFNDLFYYFRYNSTGHVTSDLGGGKYRVTFDQNVFWGNSSEGFNSGVNWCNMDAVNRTIAYQGNDYFYHRINIKIDINADEIYTSGGIRVANLKVSDGINNYFTDYKYGQNEDGIGYVSYVPYAQNIAKEVPYSAELPAPRVMYEYVTMSSHKEGSPAEGKMRYKFNVMKSKTPGKIEYGNFYKIEEVKEPTVTNTFTTTPIDVNISQFTVKDNLASIGQLLEVATFNGKGQQLSKINNTYYGMNDNVTNMGVSQESYQTYKTVDYLTNSSTVKDKWIINSSTRIKYPNIIKSSTEQKNGYTYTTDFLDYDLVSGVAKETRSVSSDGQSLRTRMIPAYLKTEYKEMGSKVDNINNKNMLSQTAANYSYILDKGTSTWKETGVGITTWSNIWSYKDIAGTSVPATAANEKIWRKHKSYVWNGVKDTNGIFENYDSTTASTDDKFDWTVGVGSQPAQWKQTSEVTLYDHYSAPLEMKDINGNFASTKMGDSDTKVMATGNAGYSEMFYAGGENLTPTSTWLEPEVSVTSASQQNGAYFHTGKKSISTTSSSQFGVAMQSGQHRAGKYKVSVWVEKTNAANARLKDNGAVVNFTESYTAGNWVLKSGYVNVPVGAYSLYVTSLNASTVYFDDLMIRPVASSVAGYVYNEWDELTHIIGNNGLATRFEYDASGRLVKTYSEVVDDTTNGVAGGFKLVKTNSYNNRRLSTAIYYNSVLSRFFTKNNCPLNYVGSGYTYIVPAGKYSSLLSQSAAEQLAQDDINANGQAVANTNGSCTYVNPNPVQPGPGQNCFVAGTDITMADGTTKAIENVAVGEKVLTYNITKRLVETGIVQEVTVTVHTELVTIAFNNHTSNTNTPDHPYFVKSKGWCSYNPEKTKLNYGLNASKLEIGDLVLHIIANNKLEAVIIKKISPISKKQKTYNLHKVSKNHDYFANGILVHNKSNQ